MLERITDLNDLENFKEIFCGACFIRLSIVSLNFWIYFNIWIFEIEFDLRDTIQPAFACTKLIIETLEQGMKYVKS